MSQDSSLWKELKDRRVVRVALVYLAVGWGIFEGSGTLTSVLGLPEVTPRLVFALVVLGFPVAVVLAWAYQVTPEGVKRAGKYRPTDRRYLPLIGGIAVSIVAFAVLAFAFLAEGEPDGVSQMAGTLDPNAIAVLPFRVNAPDELLYLGGGFMDLLAARLDGEIGPRAIDPGAVVRAASGESAEALLVARNLGAGRVVTGSVVGGSSGIVVSAEYRDVADGSLLASASVEGRPESVSNLADQLVVQLLSLSSGEYMRSVGSLTGTSPDALKAYLLGQQAWRAGRYPEAVVRFDEALTLDSTFARAAIAYVDAGTMGVGPGGGGRSELAWRHRDRLSPRDLAYLEARFPQSPQTTAERLAILEQLTTEQPDRVEAWYLRGDALFHATGMFPGAERMEQVRTIWGRALELDPAYLPVYDHLLLTEPFYASSDYLRELYQKYREQASSSPFPFLLRGLENGGIEFVFDPDIVETLDTNGLTFLRWLPLYAPDQMPGDFIVFVEAVLAEGRRRAGIDITLSSALNAEYEINLVLGRPERAEEVRQAAIREGVRQPYGRRTIYDAVWESVTTEDAETSVEMIDARLRDVSDEAFSMNDALDLTAAEIWRHTRDADYSNPDVAAAIRATGSRATHPQDLRFEAMALLFEAWAQIRNGTAASALDQLVEILDQGPGGEVVSHQFLFAVSRVFEESGDLGAALDMLDRTNYGGVPHRRFATRMWREAGRLAALTGDSARAIREYRRWLKIHTDADPSVRPAVEAVRAELARLGG